MSRDRLRLARFHRVGSAVHAVALSGDGMHALVGCEKDLRLIDRRGNVEFQFGPGEQAFNAVALAPRMEAGLAMERSGRLYRLDFSAAASEGQEREIHVAAADIWEQRDDLYSLDFAPGAGEDGAGLIALGHHALGLTAIDGRGRLLWRLGPRDANSHPGRTWHATISADGRRIYAAALGMGTGYGASTDRISMRGGQAAAKDQAERSHVIVAIDAGIGKPLRSITVGKPVTLLASLPQPLGVAAVHQLSAPEGVLSTIDTWDHAHYCMTAYDADLRKTAWSLHCPDGVMITAVASAPDAATLIVGTNTGELWRVGAFTGRVLARYELLFSSVVLSVATASSDVIAAGLANGQVALLERVTHE